MDDGKEAFWDRGRYSEGGRILLHKDYCTGNEGNSMCTVACTVHMAANNVFYIFHEGNVGRISCHREGKALYMLFYNGANKQAIDHMDVGTIHVNPFVCNRRISQNTDDHMATLRDMEQGMAHLPQSDNKAL